MTEKIDKICSDLFKLCNDMDADHIEIVVRDTDTDEPVAGVFVTTNPDLAKDVEDCINRYCPPDKVGEEEEDDD